MKKKYILLVVVLAVVYFVFSITEKSEVLPFQILNGEEENSKNSLAEELLLLHVRDYHAQNKDPLATNNYIFIFSVKKDYKRVLEEMYNSPLSDFGRNDDELIRFVASNGYTDAMKMLLKFPSVNPAANEQEALRKASEEGFDEIVSLLLQQPSVDPSVMSDYPMQIACANADNELIKILLRHPNVNPSANNNFCFHKMIKNNEFAGLELILNDSRMTLPLDYDYNKIVRKLLRKKQQKLIENLLVKHQVRIAKDLRALLVSIKYIPE